MKQMLLAGLVALAISLCTSDSAEAHWRRGVYIGVGVPAVTVGYGYGWYGAPRYYGGWYRPAPVYRAAYYPVAVPVYRTAYYGGYYGGCGW